MHVQKDKIFSTKTYTHTGLIVVLFSLHRSFQLFCSLCQSVFLFPIFFIHGLNTYSEALWTTRNKENQ